MVENTFCPPDNMYQDTKEETNEEEGEEECDTKKMKRKLTSPPMNLTILLTQASWGSQINVKSIILSLFVTSSVYISCLGFSNACPLTYELSAVYLVANYKCMT